MKNLVIFDFAGTIDSDQGSEEVIINSIKNLSGLYDLAVVSSTPSPYIKKYLKQRGVLQIFHDILGSDLYLSKSERIKNLLKKYGLLSSEAIFVTDTLEDINEAKECEVNSVAVTWGFESRENLERGKPLAIVDRPEDLVVAVKNMLK
jgi:phosphoglycolate phosphatase